MKERRAQDGGGCASRGQGEGGALRDAPICYEKEFSVFLHEFEQHIASMKSKIPINDKK